MSTKKSYEKPEVKSRAVSLGVYGEYTTASDTNIQPAPNPPTRPL